MIRIWDANTGKLVRAFGEQNGILYDEIEWLAPKGPLVALPSSFENPGDTRLTFWDAGNGVLLSEIRGEQQGE